MVFARLDFETINTVIVNSKMAATEITKIY